MPKNGNLAARVGKRSSEPVELTGEHRHKVGSPGGETFVAIEGEIDSILLPGNGPIIYGRGVQCQLCVDEAGFSGISPYLFGVVLEHFLARHVSVNSFTQTELTSIQRGLVHRWPVRMGTRSAV